MSEPTYIEIDYEHLSSVLSNVDADLASSLLSLCNTHAVIEVVATLVTCLTSIIESHSPNPRAAMEEVLALIVYDTDLEEKGTSH